MKTIQNIFFFKFRKFNKQIKPQNSFVDPHKSGINITLWVSFSVNQETTLTYKLEIDV